MHRLESKSQSEQIDTLRSRLAETEALFNASQSSVSQNEEDSAKHKAEVDKMQAEINKSNRVAKEEEEKRVKAISLLKTVRQKLVKAEKEREDALKEAAALREHDKAEKEKDAGEKNQLKKELESLNVEKDRAVSGLRTHFEKEIAGIKERHERELIAMRGQFEMEAMASKVNRIHILPSPSTYMISERSFSRIGGQDISDLPAPNISGLCDAGQE